jgi:hypothetical protein
LHPPGTPFRMPMVAYHRNYAPVGDVPPPVQEIPWQARPAWNWIRRGGIALLSGSILALLAVWAIQHADEWTLRNLEAKSPAPRDWNQKARGYWAVSLNHKRKGETQMAAWALQRALVEAGNQWILEPETVSDGQTREIDLANAFIVRTLLLWEIELQHWEKALDLERALSTAYRDDSPLNRARKCDIYRILALPAEKTKGVDAATELYRTAISYGGLDLPRDPKAPITVPVDVETNPFLLRALDEYIVFQIRNGIKSPKQALPSLLSIASVYRQTPLEVRDICGEGTVLLHIGEVMYGLGHRDESMQWTQKAVQSTQRALPQQEHEEDRQRCTECIGNGCNSLGILHEVVLNYARLISGTRRIRVST